MTHYTIKKYYITSGWKEKKVRYIYINVRCLINILYYTDTLLFFCCTNNIFIGPGPWLENEISRETVKCFHKNVIYIFRNTNLE